MEKENDFTYIQKTVATLPVFALVNFIIIYFTEFRGVSLYIFEIVFIIFIINFVITKQEKSPDAEMWVGTSVNKVVLFGFFFFLAGGLIFAFGRNYPILFILLFVGVVAWLIVLTMVVKKHTLTQMKALAQELGYSYQENGDPKSLVAPLFEVGSERKMKNVFSKTLDNLPIRIYEYYFQKGWGEKKINFGFKIFETSFNKKIPTMIIASKKEAVSSIENIKDEIVKGVEVNLEGDFSKYFSIKTTVGSERQLREILTPDVMVDLIDKTPSFSFIFCEDKLYICYKNFFTDEKTANIKDELIQASNISMYFIKKWLPTVSRLT